MKNLLAKSGDALSHSKLLRFVFSMPAGMVLFALILFSSQVTSKDLEDFMTGCGGADLSGVYAISVCPLRDSTGQSGTVQLSKWKSYTTKRGLELQLYKLVIARTEYVGSGILVFDGLKLYSGHSEGKQERDDYYLMILGASQIDNSVIGSSGFHFWADGSWGAFSTQNTGWPITGDSGLFQLRGLKKSGELDRSNRSVASSGEIVVSPREKNVIVDILFSSSPEYNYWGAGFMTLASQCGSDSFLVALMGAPLESRTVVHEIAGMSIRGNVALAGSTDQEEEVWIVPENVLAKNPKLFK